MCIKESLRLCPPVPGISRKLTKPLTFFDGRTVPEGRPIFQFVPHTKQTSAQVIYYIYGTFNSTLWHLLSFWSKTVTGHHLNVLQENIFRETFVRTFLIDQVHYCF